jgi:hypothetical protein
MINDLMNLKIVTEEQMKSTKNKAKKHDLKVINLDSDESDNASHNFEKMFGK